MEDNVALDSSKQKQFVKSIKGIKKLLKGKGNKSPASKKEDNVKTGKVKKRKPRGLVYLSHIPHGFYEHQMTEYFKQFGVVTNARVIRSKRTGMSKGHAFVEFKDQTVAEIVAETMNNYLMGKRLIKAALVPPEKQRRMARRKNWNAQFNPGSNLRQKMKKMHNEGKTESEELKIARKLLSNLNKTKKKLREIDIDYDFFMPVDIPEELMNQIAVKVEDVKPSKITKTETDSKENVKVEEAKVITNKKNKKNKPAKIEKKEESVKPPKQSSESITNKKSKETAISVTNKKSEKDTKVSQTDRKDVKETKVDNTVKGKAGKAAKKLAKENKSSKVQEEKEKKLKDAGVKSVENFIKIQNESDDDSDGSMDFDSDEFEKMIGEDDSDVQSDNEGSSEETEDALDENITSEEESVIDIPPPKKVKGPPVQKHQVAQSKKHGGKPHKNKHSLKAQKPMKNMLQNTTKPSKKPKFEKKGNQKTLNKVIKKKK